MVFDSLACESNNDYILQHLIDEYGISDEASLVSNHMVSIKSRITEQEKDDFSFYNTDKVVELRYRRIFDSFREQFFQVCRALFMPAVSFNLFLGIRHGSRLQADGSRRAAVGATERAPAAEGAGVVHGDVRATGDHQQTSLPLAVLDRLGHSDQCQAQNCTISYEYEGESVDGKWANLGVRRDGDHSDAL